jgi:hypothetical protein
MVARWAHNPKAAGSSPVAATIFQKPLIAKSSKGFLFCHNLKLFYLPIWIVNISLVYLHQINAQENERIRHYSKNQINLHGSG